MSKIEVDAIEPQSGTTLTLGASGDTITVASGASFASIGIDDNATSTAITIDSSENVDIAGTLSIDDTLSISDGTTSGFLQTSGNLLQFGTSTNDPLLIYTNNSEKMRITSGGQVLVAGTTAGDAVSEIIVDNGAATSTYGFRHQGGGRYMRMGCPNSAYAYWETNTTAGFFIDGNTNVNGTLSKSSGSFKIDHPLASKNSTHHLVHSFTESPQADLIYRGKVDLVNGTATVNIDTVAGMTEGTFVLLNRDIQCFTSNETGWTAVKGSVSENILTITAQDNTCTDTISWMVIGERQDQHMYDTEWTDDNGKVIVEPLKETEE